ncbi:MAG: ferrochelatase, partial [Bryobacterales bacterium]|nr:ferrochelatase [Bryobacterales bacterium]
TDPQALLIVSFGGPEKADDVLPFLENVLRGRNVPRERLLAVAEHYHHLGGRSPINDQNRELIAALRGQIRLPIYWGNRNWRPFFTDALREMKDDGIERALAFFTSAYSSYSGCRQYREDIARAQAEVGPGAPEIVKLPQFYNHPGFIDAMRERVSGALAELPGAEVVYTAHSIPVSMAQTSRYLAQLEEACRLVGPGPLVFQSRSGPPSQPWLAPDINDWLREHKPAKVVIVPIGFISDHMEVLYDLDTEARETCRELGIQMVRAGTVGVHPRFISMIRDMVANPPPPLCTADCCPPPGSLRSHFVSHFVKSSNSPR